MLKKMLGLRRGTDYSKDENFQTLRYGKVWILTDADDDGIHIRGLLINFFYSEYPTLVKRNYLEAFNTAVVRASFGPKKKKKNLLFYSNPQFRKWFNSVTPKPKGLAIKYYKGLGSINPKEAPGYFKNPKVVTYTVEETAGDWMDLGFSDKSSDRRKTWITRDMTQDEDLGVWYSELDSSSALNASDASQSDSESEIDLDDYSSECEASDSQSDSESEESPEEFVYEGRLSLSCFVDQQLIIYHRMALRRALPGVWDGLKEGQRKILYAIRKSKFKKTWDLERVSGMVKKETGYHHGAASLQMTLIKMGQGYVGSNNISLLVNDGEFGTRREGGLDHAQPRYPLTMLEDIVSAIFPEIDDALLERLVEDNEEVEYSTYIPVICMLLVNGGKGIGSGYSTDIPNYNPDDIVKWIEVWLKDPTKTRNLPPLKPWYRGFTGSIELTGGDKPTGWLSKGILEEGTKKDKGWWHIRELPIGLWTAKFTEWLEHLEAGPTSSNKKKKKCLATFRAYHTANTVHFKIKPTRVYIPDMTVSGNLKNLQKSRSLKNMVAIDEKNYPYRFSSPEDILECFCQKRLGFYSKRKEYLLKMWAVDLLKAENKYRFVKAVGIDRELDLHSFEEDEDLFKEMITKWKFSKINDSFDYLLGMQVRSLTRKRADMLEKEQEKIKVLMADMKAKTNKDLWKSDLAKFKVAYKKYKKTRCEE